MLANTATSVATTHRLSSIGLPWNRKKTIAPLPKIHLQSNFSLSSSSVATAVTISEFKREEQPPSDKPPKYDDPRHPWYTALPSYLSSRTIQPREEEGKEALPPYECTVYKMGYIKVKRERDLPQIESRDRSWKKLYLVLWGTIIRAYKREPTEKTQPVWSYSMQQAETDLATDYVRYDHVLRLKLSDGPQFLLRTYTREEHILWIEHLQASANISNDLDSRSMPEFIIPRRRRRMVQ
ncbi:hypothetical protein EC973_009076 [Apophysomyces ossiformis]|uniref:PH domain-containing protein n=1 Tax=Apophysomyces ossiformis TaxID=679940 RepID=A0A8H7BME4_9FUNG|nr:hypothetical protein EC973_009076 [Apophysomyces ossiformis]